MKRQSEGTWGWARRLAWLALGATWPAFYLAGRALQQGRGGLVLAAAGAVLITAGYLWARVQQPRCPRCGYMLQRESVPTGPLGAPQPLETRCTGCGYPAG